MTSLSIVPLCINLSHLHRFELFYSDLPRKKRRPGPRKVLPEKYWKKSPQDTACFLLTPAPPDRAATSPPPLIEGPPVHTSKQTPWVKWEGCLERTRFGSAPAVSAPMPCVSFAAEPTYEHQGGPAAEDPWPARLHSHV